MCALLDERDMGLLTSAMGLLLGLIARNPVGYEEAYPKICRLLTKVCYGSFGCYGCFMLWVWACGCAQFLKHAIMGFEFLFEGAPRKYDLIFCLLGQYVVQKDYRDEYTYYSLPSPWLQVPSLCPCFVLVLRIEFRLSGQVASGPPVLPRPRRQAVA